MLSLVCGAESAPIEHSTAADNGFGVRTCGEFPRHFVKVRIVSVTAAQPDEPRRPIDQVAFLPTADHLDCVAPLLVGLRYRQPVFHSEEYGQEEYGENRLLKVRHGSFLFLGGSIPPNTTSPYVLALAPMGESPSRWTWRRNSSKRFRSSASLCSEFALRRARRFCPTLVLRRVYHAGLLSDLVISRFANHHTILARASL